MTIRLAPKEGFAEVPDDVVEKIKELRKNRAKQISQEINKLKLERANVRDYRQQQIDAELKILTTSFERLKKVGGGSVRDGATRGGLGDIMMRMRRLPFEKFYLKSRSSNFSGKQDWIIGLTREIVTEIQGNHQGKTGYAGTTKYDMGKYYIAVLCQSIGGSQPTFHLMPESNPTTMARHMHHHVMNNRFDNGGKTNPLDWTPANCYGTFGGAIQGTFLNADVPELFRMLYLFTSTMNPSSPLLRLPQLPHVQEVKDE